MWVCVVEARGGPPLRQMTGSGVVGVRPPRTRSQYIFGLPMLCRYPKLNGAMDPCTEVFTLPASVSRLLCDGAL